MTLMSDFYANVAQVLALVVLTLVWQSKYFDDLNADRLSGNKLWKSTTRVRAFSVFAAAVIIADVALCLMVLGGWPTDTTAWRVLACAGLGFALASLLFRMISHILGWDRRGHISVPPVNPRTDPLALKKYRPQSIVT